MTLYLHETWNLSFLGETQGIQIIEPKPWTSIVLHNPNIDDIKDRRALDILLGIPEG